MIAEYNHPDDPSGGDGGDDDQSGNGSDNQGTIILDATCAPQNISFPQDINLLNEGRENLEAIIDQVCYEYNFYKPRMYRQNARVDQIHRNRKNRSFCKEHGIRISGPALGRPRQESYEERKRAYLDNTDRIEVERGFSLAKRCYGMGLIRTKLDTTTRASIALSVIAMNINHLAECFLRCIVISIFSRYRWQKKLPENSILACQFQWAAC